MEMSETTAIRWYKLQAVRPAPLWKCALLAPHVFQHTKLRSKSTYLSSLKRHYTGTYRDLKMLRCARDMTQSCIPQTIKQMTISKTPLELEKVLIGHEGFFLGSRSLFIPFFLTIPLSLFWRISEIRMITPEVNLVGITCLKFEGGLCLTFLGQFTP